VRIKKILEDFVDANQGFIAHDMDGNLTFLSDGDWRLKFVAESGSRLSSQDL
jgi:hypothetical protein